MTINDKKVVFFTYGTLKKDHYNHSVLGNNPQFIGEFTTPPNYTLYDGGFPVVERGGDTAIHGELYRIDNERDIQRVFDLEGSSRIQNDPNSWYTFDIIPINEEENAIIFVQNEGQSGRNQILKSGIWN